MLDNAAAQKVKKYIEEHDVSTDEGLARLIQYSHAIATKYGEGSAALSAQMYDAVAALQNANVPPAVPAPTATYNETARAVQGARLFSEKPDVTAGAVSRLVKTAGADTTLLNAARDGAQFAWVPSGDTCAFCITLASRGWQRMSHKAIEGGHAEHIHNNCDCTYAIRFSDNDTVEGYDPEVYKKMYYGAEGTTPEAKINYMRRQFYAQNKNTVGTGSKAEQFIPKSDVINRLLKKGVSVDIDAASNKEAALENVLHFARLFDEYRSTTVGYKVSKTPLATGKIAEEGGAYMLNGKTAIYVLDKALRNVKATDGARLGDQQYLGITYHEFAHSLSQSRNKTDPAFWREIRKLKREYDSRINDPDFFSKYQISTYSHQDADEFMAEAFKQAKLKKNPSPYAIRALAIIDKYFKR